MIVAQQVIVNDPVPPSGPRGGFASALARGFMLRAAERLIYLGRRRRPVRRPRGWHDHGFVTADGRLVRAVLPPDVHLFVWEAGDSPVPGGSVCDAGRPWGRVRAQSIHALSPVELEAMHRLWKQLGRTV